MRAIARGLRRSRLSWSAIAAYPATFMVTYFNVAFPTLAAAAIDGRPMTTAQAFDRARSRLGPLRRGPSPRPSSASCCARWSSSRAEASPGGWSRGPSSAWLGSGWRSGRRATSPDMG
jgi:hypothetical protein